MNVLNIPECPLNREHLSNLSSEQRLRLLDRIVERAVRNHALNCGIPTVEKWASEWLDDVCGRRRQEASQAGIAALRKHIEERESGNGQGSRIAKAANAATNAAHCALEHEYYERVPEWSARASDMFDAVLRESKIAAAISADDKQAALEAEHQLQLADLQVVLSEAEHP